MDRRRFTPSAALRGSVAPPPDKSISHRAALLGAMCDHPVLVRNYLAAEDTRATLAVARAVGAGVDERGGDLAMRGVGLRGALPSAEPLSVANAGTLMRILPGWLAAQPGGTWTIDGDASIRRRPVERVVEPLRRMGAEIEATNGHPPLHVRGAELTGSEHKLEVASAQVKSSLLIAGMLAAGQTAVREPAPSRDHTERMLRRAGLPLEQDGLTTRISQVESLELDDLAVPGDPSSAAFLVAAACVVPGSHVVVRGVALNWTRTGFLRIARRMGAAIAADLEAPGTVSEHEPTGELEVTAEPLHATTVEPDEVPLAIDELPLVGLLGAFAEGETVVRGAQELRVKESDRVAGVVEGLRGVGARIEAAPDGFVVHGEGGLRGGELDARGDHRLAMLGAVAGLAATEGVEVAGMESVAVSYPRFEDDLASLLTG